ncbi:MAG: O-succinylhomoserine sulfhydrylase [Burkholderiaceae bacterium]
MADDFDFDTLAVRAGTLRTEFGEHSEALFLTSSFTFQSAAQAAARFANADEGYTYSRVGNPTVRMFESRLAALEGAEDALATATGMAAIFTAVIAVLRAGDHAICAANAFGATVQLFTNLLPRFGIEVSFVEDTAIDAWRALVRPNTRLLFAETPSNPLTALVDIAALSALGRDIGAVSVIDNCFCSPVAQQPLALGADVVVHSATKYLDGQGRVLGGAVVGSRAFIRDQALPILRTAGMSLSPFNAWVLLKGLETLPLRMRAQSENALAIARWLEAHPAIARVHFPGLPSHPQYELAQRQQQLPGAIVCFELAGSGDAEWRERAWSLIDRVRLMSITANLGDTRSTITHPATTTHGRLTPAARARAGVGEGLIRMSVGLESPRDLMGDLEQALAMA